jgi:hypothetical protein
VGYGLVRKSFAVGCTFEEVVEKIEHQKMSVILFQPNYHESSHLVSKGQNPIKLLYSIIILNTISLPSNNKSWKKNNM